MFEQFKFIFEGFVKKPLAMICGLLAGGCIYLSIELITARKSDDAKEEFYRGVILKCSEEKVQREKDFAQKLEQINDRETKKTEDQIRVLNEVISTMKRQKR